MAKISGYINGMKLIPQKHTWYIKELVWDKGSNTVSGERIIQSMQQHNYAGQRGGQELDLSHPPHTRTHAHTHMHMHSLNM